MSVFISSECRKFFVVIPVHKKIQFFEACLKSVLEQVYENLDLNIIILDNTPDDSLKKFVESFQDSRMKIISERKPLDIYSNWSRINSFLKNNYFEENKINNFFMTFLGYDDLLKANFIEEINNLINKYPEASLYRTHCSFIDSKDKFIKLSKIYPEKLTGSDFLVNLISFSDDSTATGYVFRVSDYLKLEGLPDYKDLLFSDLALWLKLSSLSYMAVSKKICFHNRWHGLNTSSLDKKKEINLESWCSAFENFINLLIQIINNNPDIKNSELTAYFLADYISSYSRKLQKKAFKQANYKNNKLLQDKFKSWFLAIEQKTNSLSDLLEKNTNKIYLTKQDQEEQKLTKNNNLARKLIKLQRKTNNYIFKLFIKLLLNYF